MSLGSYMYPNAYISKSNVACQDTCLIISLSENGAFPTIGIPWTHPLLLSIYIATVPFMMGATLTTVKESYTTKTVRVIKVTKD